MEAPMSWASEEATEVSMAEGTIRAMTTMDYTSSTATTSRMAMFWWITMVTMATMARGRWQNPRTLWMLRRGQRWRGRCRRGCRWLVAPAILRQERPRRQERQRWQGGLIASRGASGALDMEAMAMEATAWVDLATAMAWVMASVMASVMEATDSGSGHQGSQRTKTI